MQNVVKRLIVRSAAQAARGGPGKLERAVRCWIGTIREEYGAALHHAALYERQAQASGSSKADVARRVAGACTAGSARAWRR